MSGSILPYEEDPMPIYETLENDHKVLKSLLKDLRRAPKRECSTMPCET